MFGTVHDIQIMPQQVVVKRLQRRLFKVVKTALEARSETKSADQIEWGIDACRELLARDRCSGNLQVTFSDLWARYDLFSLGENELSDEDTLSLARAQFASQYPAASAWPLRLAQQGKQLLVVGMNPALLAALEQVAADSGCRLVQLAPWFARVLNDYEKEIGQEDGWVLFDEPGMLIVALLNKGLLTSMHCQHCDDDQRESTAQLLLNRQTALLGHPAGEVRIFSFSGSPLVLQEPWRCSQFLIVSPHADNAALPASLLTH